ncbi:MAG: ATP-binding protein [Candidatus Electronema sp. VV]
MSLLGTARPVCPFVTAGTIEDPGLFVGRKDELRRLAGWMSGSQPVSVNVVGGRLSGKSSLLQHFTQTYAQRVTEPGRFLVVCICLRLAKPKTEAEFYQTLAAALSKLRAVAQCKPLRTALASCSGGGKKEFTDLLDLLSGRHLLPVFCLDEFEKLFDHKDTHYDSLHSLTNSNKMMLIIATRRPVEIVAEGQQLLPAFFNFGQVCELKAFSEEEAVELLLLPDPSAPALNADERRLARKWGGCQPHLLQLAASVLFDARQAGKDAAWAKQQFEQARKRSREKSVWTKPLSAKAIAQGSRNFLTALAEDAENCKKVLLSLVPLAALAGLFYALLTGKMPAKDAPNWLLKLS